jgi:hypothetical protein
LAGRASEVSRAEAASGAHQEGRCFARFRSPGARRRSRSADRRAADPRTTPPRHLRLDAPLPVAYTRIRSKREESGESAGLGHDSRRIERDLPPSQEDRGVGSWCRSHDLLQELRAMPHYQPARGNQELSLLCDRQLARISPEPRIQAKASSSDTGDPAKQHPPAGTVLPDAEGQPGSARPVARIRTGRAQRGQGGGLDLPVPPPRGGTGMSMSSRGIRS